MGHCLHLAKNERVTISVCVMLVAEELALVAIDPSSGHHALGVRSELNACLAGLLVAELLLDGVLEIGAKEDRVIATGKAEPKTKVLAAATAVVIDRGPKIKAILSHMDKGLSRQLDLGTWDAIVSSLVDEGVLAPTRRGCARATMCSSLSCATRPLPRCVLRPPVNPHSSRAPPCCCR